MQIVFPTAGKEEADDGIDNGRKPEAVARQGILPEGDEVIQKTVHDPDGFGDQDFGQPEKAEIHQPEGDLLEQGMFQSPVDEGFHGTIIKGRLRPDKDADAAKCSLMMEVIVYRQVEAFLIGLCHGLRRQGLAVLSIPEQDPDVGIDQGLQDDFFGDRRGSLGPVVPEPVAHPLLQGFHEVRGGRSLAEPVDDRRIALDGREGVDEHVLRTFAGAVIQRIDEGLTAVLNGLVLVPVVRVEGDPVDSCFVGDFLDGDLFRGLFLQQLEQGPVDGFGCPQYSFVHAGTL